MVGEEWADKMRKKWFLKYPENKAPSLSKREGDKLLDMLYFAPKEEWDIFDWIRDKFLKIIRFFRRK